MEIINDRQRGESTVAALPKGATPKLKRWGCLGILADWLSCVQTFSGTNSAALTVDFDHVVVIATTNHFTEHLKIYADDLFGFNSRAHYYQYRVDKADQGRQLYTVGVFGDGKRRKLHLGTGYAVLQLNNSAAQTKVITTWKKHKPLRGANTQVVMVNAAEARKYFKCETPEQAMQMNLCWVGDTEALMSGDKVRVERAREELRQAGWELF